MGFHVLLAAALALAAPTQAAQPRFEVLAHVPAPGGYSGDVVGYRGFAYLSSHRGVVACPAQGVRVYDLSNPRRPRHVSTFADGRSESALAQSLTEKTIVRHVATSSFTGDIAATSIQACRSGEGFGGFALYDVTDPARPTRLALVRLEPRGSHEIWLADARGHAWVYTAILRSEQLSNQPGFRIYDVSDPRRPREVGSWGAVRELGIDPNGGVGVANSAYGPFVHSVITNAAVTRAFLSYWDLGTVILDIHDPAHPRYLGRTSFLRGEEGNAHSAWLGRGERLLAETHEATGGAVTFYDVSDPHTPRRLSVFRLPRSVLTAGRRGNARYIPISGLDLTNSVHDPKLVGDRGYFSWYSQGVVLADISNPRRPRLLARFRPTPARDRYGLVCPGRVCTAVWGVFPERGYVLASDIISGLWVLRVR